MTIKSKKFKKGIKLDPTTSPATEEGEIRNDSADNKLKTYTEGAEREVVTADQAQTLSNKTIDSASNTITVDADEATVENLEVDNLKAGVLDIDGTFSAATDTKLPSSQAVKTYVDSQVASKDEASEISYDNTTSGLTATEVQSAVDEVEGRLDTAETNISTNASGLSDHLADTVDAHDASAISNVPAGNLAATDVQGALDELQTDVDTRALDADLTAHINDAVDAHDASAVSFDNVTSGLTATTAQAAIDEVEGRLDTAEADVVTAQATADNHIADASGAHAASAISNIPSGNLAATDVQTALDELQTDIDTRATDADLTAHTGASSGVHGVTGDVVGTTDTQTLTNKTLSGASIEDPTRLDVKKDTKANLTVYATTATNGQFVFATDTKEMLQIVDNTLVTVGSGSGGGLDVFFTETFEQTVASDLTSGNNATFLGGGTLAGTLSDEEVSQIKGDRSIKYTQASGSLNDYVALDAITLELKEKDNTCGLTVYTTYDGNDSEVDLVVYDVTNSEVLVSVPIKASTSALKHEGVFNTASTTASLRVGFQTKVENIGAVLLVDDFELKTNPFATTELYASSEWEAFTPTGSYSGGSYEGFKRRNGSNLEVRGRFTASGAVTGFAIIDIPDGLTIDTTKLSSSLASLQTFGQSQFYDESAGTTNVGGVQYQSSTQVAVTYFSDNGTLEDRVTGTATAPFTFANNDRVQFNFSVPIAGWSNTRDGVVVKGQTSEFDWQDYTPIYTGFGTVSTSNLRWRRDSDSIEIMGTFVTGTPTAVEGQISLPNSYVISSGLTGGPVAVGHWVRGNSVASSNKDFITLATAGDGFINFGVKERDEANSPLAPINGSNLGSSETQSIYAKIPIQGLKESDKVYTVPVDSLTGNSVRAESNGANVLTTSDPIPFTEVTDPNNAWNGTQYTVQKSNSKITLVGQTQWSTTANRYMSLYKNGSLVKHYTRNGPSLNMHTFTFVLERGEVVEGDTLEIRSTNAAGTLSAGGSFHYITVSEEYGDRGIFLGNIPTESIKEKTLSVNVTTTGDLSDLTFTGLEIGKWYEVTGYVTSTINNSTNDLSFRGGASGTGTLYGKLKHTSSASESNLPIPLSFKFKADSSTLYVNGVTVNGTIVGDGTRNTTLVQLTALNATR